MHREMGRFGLCIGKNKHFVSGERTKKRRITQKWYLNTGPTSLPSTSFRYYEELKTFRMIRGILLESIIYIFYNVI